MSSWRVAGVVDDRPSGRGPHRSSRSGSTRIYVGCPVLSLCQIAAVKARVRCKTRTQTHQGPAAVAFQVQLPLEVWLTDSISCRKGLKQDTPARFASPLRAGRNSRRPSLQAPADTSRRYVELAPALFSVTIYQ